VGATGGVLEKGGQELVQDNALFAQDGQPLRPFGCAPPRATRSAPGHFHHTFY
jgi:hypothetical protein